MGVNWYPGDSGGSPGGYGAVGYAPAGNAGSQGRVMHIRWWWHLSSEGQQKLEDASAEADRSRQLHEEDRQVTQRVQDLDSHNMYAEMIRKALTGGYQPPRSRAPRGGANHG